MFFLRVAAGIDFVNRGDAGGADLTFAAMTVDNVFHDWDISAIIPAGTKLVLIRIWRMQTSSASNEIKFRPKGGEDEYNIERITCPVGATKCYASRLVIPDANGVIQYLVHTSFSNANFLIGGWFK